jgi:murein peptide amidase A
MAGNSSSKLRPWVIGFWVVNLIFAITLASIWLIPRLSPTQSGEITHSSIAETTTPTVSITLTHTPTFPPTTSHTRTPSPTPTFTPIPFREGPIVIGLSVERRFIEVFRFGTGPVERLIVAGMHGGGEYNTIQLADELIAYITEHPAIIPEKVTLYILRDLNPDGEARSHTSSGRANANNVDLNRNWDANWQKVWNRTGCWPPPITGGTGPASEPETQALAAFILSHHFDALINYHSAALGIFPGGLPPSDKSINLAETIAEITTYPYPPITNGCHVTGGFTD